MIGHSTAEDFTTVKFSAYSVPYFVYTNSLAFRPVEHYSVNLDDKWIFEINPKLTPKMNRKWTENEPKMNRNWTETENIRKIEAFKDGSELMFDYLFFTPPGNTLKNMELDFIPAKQRKAL